MNEQLHPLTLSEILDRTAYLYRSRFLVFLGIALIPAGTVFVFAAGIFAFIAWLGSNARTGGTVADVFVWVFLILLLVLVVPGGLGASALGEAAMSDSAARLFLGETITIRSAYKNAWKRGWRFVGLFTLQALAIYGVPVAVFSTVLIAISVSAALAGGGKSESALFGAMVFLVLAVLAVIAIWVLLRLCLAFPVSVVERATAWNSLKRSGFLSQGTRPRILVLYVLGIVLNQVLSWGFTIPALIVISLIPGLQGQAHAQTTGVIVMFLVYGSYFAVKAFTKPIYGIALTLFYFDQRIRKEGFDIEWMMQQAGMVTTPAPDPIQPAEPIPVVASVATEEPVPDVVSVVDVADQIPMHETLLPSVQEEGKA